MGRVLKVFGTSLDGRNRHIVAARSMSEAARLFRTTRGRISKYASITGNELEIEIAMAKPGVVFEAPLHATFSKKYRVRK